MTTFALGRVTGALPTPPSGDYEGRVNAIVVAADPAATGITYFQQIKQNGVALGSPLVICAFNKPATTGGLGQPYRHEDFKGLNDIDPTEFSIGQAVGGEGCFVTYCWL